MSESANRSHSSEEAKLTSNVFWDYFYSPDHLTLIQLLSFIAEDV